MQNADNSYMESFNIVSWYVFSSHQKACELPDLVSGSTVFLFSDIQ